MASMAALGKAAGVYQSLFNNHVPVCWANIKPAYKYPWKSWRMNLLPYAPGVAAFNCPAANNSDASVFHSEAEMAGQDMDDTINAGSYGVMYQFSRASYKTLNYSGVKTTGHPMWSNSFDVDAAWQNPANSVYLADCFLSKGPLTYPSQSYTVWGSSAILPPSAAGYRSTSVNRRFADRHDGTNCLFLDGRVVRYVTADLDGMVAGDSRCIWDTD